MRRYARVDWGSWVFSQVRIEAGQTFTHVAVLQPAELNTGLVHSHRETLACTTHSGASN